MGRLGADKGRCRSVSVGSPVGPVNGASAACAQVEKVDQRSAFETRRFMREQGLGNPIRALWYMTQVNSSGWKSRLGRQ